MDVPAEIRVEDPEPAGPSGARLLVTSLGVFFGIVMLGGVIGVLLSQSESDIPVTLSAAAAEIATDTSAAEEPAPPIVVPTPTTAAPRIPEGDVVANEEAESSTVEVLEVVELNVLPDLALAVDGAVEVPAEADTVEFLELPKAVFDRFDLQIADSFAINIAANDKIGGELQAVELTELGELAPGFSLSPDGTLSGTATECGKWSAQYALKSTNPAIGTSWIEITVAGCAGT